jgi:uncharacterized membrane protein YfhO
LDTNLYFLKAKKIGIYIYESKIAMPLTIAYDNYITEENFLKLSQWNKEYVLFKALVVNKDNLNQVKYLKAFNLNDTISKNNKLALIEAANERKAMLNQQLKITNKSVSGSLKTIKPCVISFQIPYDGNWNLELNAEKINLFNGNIGFFCFKNEKTKFNIELNY